MSSLASSPQAWHIPRRHPRVSLDIPVEVRTNGTRLMAHSSDLSIGGVKLHTPQTFRPGTPVSVRFNLPDGHTISSRAKVIHENGGTGMGLAFTHQQPETRRTLGDFTCRMIRYARRGERIARRYHLLVRGSGCGHTQEELAETVMISRHGGLLVTRIRYNVGEEIHVTWPRDVDARIVSRRECASGGLVELGFEFLDGKEFWDCEFPGRL